MASLSSGHMRRLRLELQAVFGGPNPQGDYWLFLLEHLSVRLGDLTSPTASFPLQIAESIVKLNTDGHAPELLDALEQEYPQAAALLQVISEIRAEAKLRPQDVEAARRLRALEQAYLLLDGLPVINRERLREIMDELLGRAAQARVGVVAGAPLSGKSWSLHLIQAYCRAIRPPNVRLILLDLQKLQPENDPVVVWTELMMQLLQTQTPPKEPDKDTKGGQYVQRLVERVLSTWNAQTAADDDEMPWLLIIFDHLDKKAAAAVGPTVVDFAEALANAAVEPLVKRVRVLLLGFPRAFNPAQALSIEEVAPREELGPLTMEKVRLYLADVGKAIGRGAAPETEAAAEQALREAEAKTEPEERRTALLKMSATIGRHVSVLAKADGP